MILKIPLEMQAELITAIYILIAIIIFLWGRAIGVNQTTELYKLQDEKSEILELRRENKRLKFDNDKLRESNKFYLNLFSSMRHLIKKGE